MLSAAIAYRELPPAPRAEVVRLLRAHPHWVQRETVPAGLDEVALHGPRCFAACSRSRSFVFPAVPARAGS